MLYLSCLLGFLGLVLAAYTCGGAVLWLAGYRRFSLRPAPVAASIGTGVAGATSLFAIIQNQGLTIMLGFVFVLGILMVAKPARPTAAPPLQAKDALALLLLVVFSFSISFASRWDAKQDKVIFTHGDQSHYVLITTFLPGQPENSRTYQNAIEPGNDVYTPYHYFEFWFAHLVHLSGPSPFSALFIYAKSVLLFLVLLAGWAYLEKIHIRPRWLFQMCGLLFLISPPFFYLDSFYQFGLTHEMLHLMGAPAALNVKYLPWMAASSWALVTLDRKQYILSIGLLLAMAICSVTAIPGSYLAIAVIILITGVLRYASLKQIMISVALVMGFTLHVFVLYGLTGDASARPPIDSPVDSVLRHFGTFVNVLGKTFLQLIMLLLPLLALLSAMSYSSTSRNYLIRDGLQFLLCALLIAGGYLGYALNFTALDSNQFVASAMSAVTGWLAILLFRLTMEMPFDKLIKVGITCLLVTFSVLGIYTRGIAEDFDVMDRTDVRAFNQALREIVTSEYSIKDTAAVAVLNNPAVYRDSFYKNYGSSFKYSTYWVDTLPTLQPVIINWHLAKNPDGDQWIAYFSENRPFMRYAKAESRKKETRPDWDLIQCQFLRDKGIRILIKEPNAEMPACLGRHIRDTLYHEASNAMVLRLKVPAG